MSGHWTLRNGEREEETNPTRETKKKKKKNQVRESSMSNSLRLVRGTDPTVRSIDQVTVMVQELVTNQVFSYVCCSDYSVRTMQTTLIIFSLQGKGDHNGPTTLYSYLTNLH